MSRKTQSLRADQRTYFRTEIKSLIKFLTSSANQYLIGTACYVFNLNVVNK